MLKAFIIYFLIFILEAMSFATEANPIKGIIDSVDNTTGKVSGWACANGIASSIAIHVYCGGSAGSGEFAVAGAADKSSESAVAAECGTQFDRYRFQLDLPPSCSNKTVFVHGISPVGGTNSLLYRSGDFTYSPKIPPPSNDIEGFIDEVNSSTGVLSGWACAKGISKSVDIHVYCGGPAGKGSFAVAGTANLNSEQAVSDACKTQYKNYRYQIALPSTCLDKSVFAHGISPVGGENKLLYNSGKWTYHPPIKTLSDYLTKLGLPKKSKQDIFIPKGYDLLIDTELESGNLVIEGQLRCDNEKKYNTSLKVSNLIVQGDGAIFECGTSKKSFKGNLQIILSDFKDYGGGMGAKTIGVHHGGQIQLYGDDQRNAVSFTRLSSSVNPGEKSLTLRQAVPWRIGDRIGVATTSFNPYENDVAVIQEIRNSGRTIILDRPLQFFHNGLSTTFKNESDSWVLDESGFVVNFTRNITISSEEDTWTQKNLGAHFMVMKGGRANIDAVEFFRVGQMGILARYPFHWHRLGDNGAGQSITHSTIHESYSRCITIHATNQTLVSDNVCANHFGHGYFLEDGVEVNNIIKNNLGALSRKPPTLKQSLLISDKDSTDPARFASPSTFWISNPKNDVQGNVAIGSEGSGFWMAFVRAMVCDSNYFCDRASTPYPPNAIQPIISETTAFNNNIAQSSVVGFTWDGAPDGDLVNTASTPEDQKTVNPNDRRLVSAHYSPSQNPTFKNLVAIKNSITGIYFRGNGGIFERAVLADNANSFFVAYNQTLRNSLVVGKSPFFNSQADFDYLGGNSPFLMRSNFSGIRVYDGPFQMENVHFAGYDSNLVRNSRGDEITPIPFINLGAAERFVNIVRHVSFALNTIPRKIFLSEEQSNWRDNFAIGVRDMDGDLSGRPGSLLVPDHSWNQDDKTCSPFGFSSRTLICSYPISHLRFLVNDNPLELNATIWRHNLNTNQWLRLNLDNMTWTNLFNKFSMISDNQFEYFVDQLDFRKTSNGYLKFSAEHLNDVSPYVTIRSPLGCENATKIKIDPPPYSQFVENGNLKLRFKASDTNGAGQYYKEHFLTCLPANARSN